MSAWQMLPAFVVAFVVIVGARTVADWLVFELRRAAARVRRTVRRHRAAATTGNCPCGGDMESCTCGKGPALPPRAVPSWARDGAR